MHSGPGFMNNMRKVVSRNFIRILEGATPLTTFECFNVIERAKNQAHARMGGSYPPPPESGYETLC